MLVSVVPVYFLMASVGGYYTAKYAGRIVEHSNKATSIASSCLSHLPLVRAFNANERLEAIFAHNLLLARTDARKKALTHAIQLGLLYFVAYSSNALAFWQGSRMIAAKVANGGSDVSVGAVYTVIFVLLDDASSRLEKIIGKQSEIDPMSADGSHEADLEGQPIVFKDVWFSYPSRPEVSVLQGIDLQILPSKHTAIVGSSGGGKSTIVALLERFYDPASGTVSVGDLDFKDINVHYLRGRIGYVPQEPTLLDRSILENIAHGLAGSSDPEYQDLIPVLLDSTLSDAISKMQNGVSVSESATDPRLAKIMELVKEAAIAANAYEFIENLPQGLATSVGAAGHMLSGGQKQRIALARALVRRPRILLLDEATAALDSTSEQLIQTALQKLSNRLTIVSIAHRLATAKDADNIVVVQKGRVIEQGTHSQLIADNGVYAGMVRLQNLERVELNETISRNSMESSSSGLMEKSMIAYENEDSTQQGSDKTDKDQNESQKPEDAQPPTDKKLNAWSVSRNIYPLIRPNMAFILLGLIAAAVVGGSYSGEAILFGHTVGSLSPCKGEDSIRHSGHLYGLWFFILALIELTAVVVSGSAFGWAADKLLYRTRVMSLQALLRKSLNWHNSNGRKPGTLLSYITSDATALGGLTGTTIGLLFSTAINLIAGIVISHIIAWKIAVVLLATIPVLLCAGIMKLRVQAQFAERHQKAFANATAITVEAVNEIRIIAAFSLESEVYQVYSRSLKGPYDATLKAIAWSNVWLALAFSISNLVYALAYWWGSRQIAAGLYSPTQFFIVLPALLFSTQSCGQMFALAPDISKANLAASNIVKLISDRSEDEQTTAHHLEIPDNEKMPDYEAQSGLSSRSTSLSEGGIGVQFRGVQFTYPSRPDRTVLKGLDLQFLPGQFCALVGPSGSGKSTIFNMIERFYRPTAGSVVIDRTDIAAHDDISFRDAIALVPQDNVLFQGTVAFNIGLGARPGHEASQAEIEEACRLANIHETIMALPEGYQTVCNQDGKQFSGGQRQRLSIARALVRKPRLLLLDESTSALDVESEKRIQDALATVAQNRAITVIAIAHRLNTIYRADQIYLIQDGRCVDQGTHAELIQRSDSYRTSVVHQSLEV
ncbi:hypothetical protein EIK77_008166 [Talaromyces pinophilus]|nr:hypothetical protein EIK77_008166 [Talaromyces pinophilus]